MADNSFIHLHVHSEFSLLDGLSRIEKLVNRAKKLNMPALAVTDHGTMFGVMDFYNAAIKAKIKPIIGVETYLAPRGMEDKDAQLDKRAYHLLLLAKNEVGYRNLLKISSESQLRGYYYRPRIDMEFLSRHAEGLIGTTGCLAGIIPRLVGDGQDERAREMIGQFTDIFGADSFYLELQKHDIPELDTLNKWLVDYNRTQHTNVGLLATNDVHYVFEEDYDAHDTLLCIQTSALKQKQNRMRMSDNSYFLSSTEDMWRYFGEVPEAITNSQKITDMCEVNLDRKGYHLPVFPVPAGYDAKTYLRYLCDLGMKWRFDNRANDPHLLERLESELDIIHTMGFDTYFLIVWDLCEFARHADIWWNVRGSGAGSLAAYCLGITNIDPIQNNLLFERFLNPGRVSMPDIDLDYPDDRRGEMIAYTAQKYGEDKVAAIITFGTLGAKAAIRDVGRALEMPLEDVNRIASLIPTEAKQKPIMTYVESNPDLEKLYKSSRQVREVIETAQLLQGVSRHASTHAAGVIVADKPLDEYIPLHRVTGTDPSGGSLKAVTQFTMETCEAIGLLKVDFLGLSTLTILRKAADLIKQHHNINYTMDNIPYRHDDPRMTDRDKKMLDEAFEMIGRGETVGVFQVESSGMQQMLRGMRPHRFEHIIAAVSLYRPGPMEFIPQYNRRLHDEEKTEYRHERLESILKETYGIFVYQEQIMQVAGDLFDYELGEADLMRRAVSKKKEKDLRKHRAIFLERGPKNGIDEETAGKIFDDIEFFANYGFNKCVVGNTEIVDPITGRLIRVGDLAAGRVELDYTLSCDTKGLRLQMARISAVMNNGVKPVFRLTTQSGRQIEATANHPFFTFSGWQMLGQLKPGDQIATSRWILVETHKSLPEYLISELAHGVAAGKGEIPEIVFELQLSYLAMFIAYLWEINGVVDVQARHVDCQLATVRQARQLQHLLLRLNILSRIQKLPDSRYSVCITENQSLKGFKNIGRYSVNRKDYLTALSYMLSMGEDRSQDTQEMFVVNVRKVIEDEKDEKGISWTQAAQKAGVPVNVYDRIANKPGLVSHEVLSELAEFFDSEKLRSFVDNDVYWDRIISIEAIGEQPTYDLTIEGTHNFVANDIIVHNSHAADYAVITVHTAFLKCHYPEEYMAALLSVQRDNSDKVTHFLEECRRLQIPILPPDVNYSALDFDIHPDPETGRRGIRFGLAAIKNAGAGALQPIIAAREAGGPFSDLVEFTQRVDLREVGKRTLESLIKVGAMGKFGKRAQLLDALERISNFSASYHKDQEVGQINMFGESTGLVDDSLIDLPEQDEFDDRKMLGWEKELLGFYVSGRPVDKYRYALQQLGSFDVARLKQEPEKFNDKEVQIAGEIVNLRKIFTRNNDAMGVLQIEDWHDSANIIEVVLFPRTWDQIMAQVESGEITAVQEGEVVRIAGKFDVSRGDPQIIADTLAQNFDYVLPKDGRVLSSSPPIDEPEWVIDEPEPPPFFQNEPPMDGFYAEDLEPGTAPPPSLAVVEAVDSMPPPVIEREQVDDTADPNYTPPDFMRQTAQLSQKHWVKVYFSRTGDDGLDRRRLRRLHGIFVSYHGEDQFSITIEANDGTPVEIAFPSHTTGFCDDLVHELLAIVQSEDNIEIHTV